MRPLFSGRDYHALHRENPSFCSAATVDGARVRWRPYAALPAVVALTNGSYVHAPDWYRNFLYAEETRRGLDDREDLVAPGVLQFDLSAGDACCVLTAEGFAEGLLRAGEGAAAALRRLQRSEQERRDGDRLRRAADAYVVRRGTGKTIVAGYPWFTDWGRDTFIALRGLCLHNARLDEARDILVEWAGSVSEGMLPNRFPDRGGEPEFNSVDASLWYVIAAHELLAAARARRVRMGGGDRTAVTAAIDAILRGYARGTRFGIRADADGLLAAGVEGVQLTWMDAKVGDWVVTPRIGKPVEVQALWLNALAVGATWSAEWKELLERGRAAFCERFWNDADACLYDVVDVGHAGG